MSRDIYPVITDISVIAFDHRANQIRIDQNENGMDHFVS